MLLHKAPSAPALPVVQLLAGLIRGLVRGGVVLCSGYVFVLRVACGVRFARGWACWAIAIAYNLVVLRGQCRLQSGH